MPLYEKKLTVSNLLNKLKTFWTEEFSKWLTKISKESRKQKYAKLFSQNTVMENKVSAELRRRGYRFRRNVKNLEGKPDIAIKKYRVAIFRFMFLARM